MKIKYTKTATFLFPLIDIPRSTFDCKILYPNGNIKYDTRFLNAYLGDISVLQYKENHVFVTVRNFRDKNFDEFYLNVTSHKNYKDSYEKERVLVLIFEVSPEFISDYHLVLQGLYSKISDKAKGLIMKNFYFSGKPVGVPMILQKAMVMKQHWDSVVGDPGIGDQDVYSKIVREEELLSDNTIRALNIGKITTSVSH